MEQQLTNTEIDKLTTEILVYKQQTAQNIIEIGRRLIKVKESLPHGEWGKWLEEKVNFTRMQANRFIRVATEFGNDTLKLKELTQSKIFALLDLPSDQREDFITQAHEIRGQTKTVDEMTTREFQQAIKDKKMKNRKSISKTTEKHLINKSNGHCEICNWGGIGLEGILIPHHIHKYAKTENNSVDNLVMICPNCHQMIHTLENCKDEKMIHIIQNSIDESIINNIKYYVNILKKENKRRGIKI